MVIGDFLAYSSIGQGSAYAQKPQMVARPAVTLEAEPDPKTPHQYSVNTKPQVIPPPERPVMPRMRLKSPTRTLTPLAGRF